MAKNLRKRVPRLRVVPQPERAALDVTIAAFRRPAEPVDVPLSGAASDEQVEQARELAKRIGWRELLAT
jgi:hypothetical protein